MTDTLTPPPLPGATDNQSPRKASSWTISVDVPVGAEVVHVVARMAPDSVGEARARERMVGIPLVEQLIPYAETAKAVAVAAWLVGNRPDALLPLVNADAGADAPTPDQVALAVVDGLPLAALIGGFYVEYV